MEEKKKQISKLQKDAKSKHGPAEIGFKLDSLYLSTTDRNNAFKTDCEVLFKVLFSRND